MIAIDSSAEQIGAARARGLDARRGRAETLPFKAEFDAVFSNAVLHWIPRRRRAVIASVHRALKPGGRFVAEFGGAGCVQTVRLALIDAANRRGLDGAALDPWFFPTEAAYRALLEAHGFAVRAITLFPRPTPLPGDITDWLETFAQPFLGAVPAGDRARLHAGRARRRAARRCSIPRAAGPPTTSACASTPARCPEGA